MEKNEGDEEEQECDEKSRAKSEQVEGGQRVSIIMRRLWKVALHVGAGGGYGPIKLLGEGIR